MSWRVPLAKPIYTIFGANTGVGKTIISTLLVKAFAPHISYIKPVSTGPLSEADYLHVNNFSGVRGHVLYQFEVPCSPHLAAGPDPPSDSIILSKLTEQLESQQNYPTLIETAGGVHSPAPSGSSQLDLYRPHRFPVILVADSNLGGISTTISAYESLRLHGFDVAAIVGFKANWGNLPYLASKLPVPTIQIPAPPPRHENLEEDAENMSVYYDLISSSPAIKALKMELNEAHEARLQRLREMPERALEKIWYPFTQHSLLSPETVTTMDSALNDDFAVFKSDKMSLKPVFDGSASWWTQGLGHGNPELALEAAYASSRYGHVILPNAVNEPALALAEKLLATVGKGWASRVYYSDNGATGIEVALKMALKASRVRYGESKEELNLGIIALTGAYHGDTMGAMDAADPNVYNAEVDWYQPRGLFFDPPSLLMTNGQWHLSIPDQARPTTSQGGPATFNDLGEVFDIKSRLKSPIAELYRTWINDRISTALANGQRFGALMFEPILLGAGGMVFVDPLFQNILVSTVRSSTSLCPPPPDSANSAHWTGLPVITDEVFTGLFRLSLARSFDLLHIKPDISVNAKLLTGGLVPLATTLATEEIFEIFKRPGKEDALLHGHSYTAHPIGTSVASMSIDKLVHLFSPATQSQKDASGNREDEGGFTFVDSAGSIIRVPSIWSNSFLSQISHHEAITGVLAIGSVLSLTLSTTPSPGSTDVGVGGAEKGGYTSAVSVALCETLKREGIMVRPLGNVVYVMASQVTHRSRAKEIETIIKRALG